MRTRFNESLYACSICEIIEKSDQKRKILFDFLTLRIIMMIGK